MSTSTTRPAEPSRPNVDVPMPRPGHHPGALHCTPLSDWRALRRPREWRAASIGFVPTMGALRGGRVALRARARAENQRVVLSIFVNPTQFNDPNDLTAYPRTLEADLALAA